MERTTHDDMQHNGNVFVLKGVECRNGTACPDQLASVLEAE